MCFPSCKIHPAHTKRESHKYPFFLFQTQRSENSSHFPNVQVGNWWPSTLFDPPINYVIKFMDSFLQDVRTHLKPSDVVIISFA